VYNIRPPLPAVGGNEGVAEVVEAGAQVSDLQKGDWVLPAAPGFGTWRTLAVAPAASFIRVRSDIPAEYAATVSVNPCTAYRMLRDFVALKPGDVIMQNGSNSAVGVAVIQLARRMRVRTINIIRDRPDLSYVLSRLTSWGADLVFTEDEIRGPKAREALAKLPKPVLGLNCVGGTSAAEVARLLADGAQLITYGGMSRKPVTVPTGTLIFNDIVVRGFWMSRWIATHSRAERSAMLDDLLEMIHNGELEANIETVPFARFSDALLRSKQGYRTHKVVLKFE
jgi:trans-2-enoyl-CoA reductase